MNDPTNYTSVTSIIMRRWTVVVGVSAVALLLGYLVSSTLTEQYEATATVLTAQEPPRGNVPDADRVTKEQLALTFADIGRRPAVLEPAAEELGMAGGWKPLRAAVTIRLVPRTLLLEVNATATSPAEAERRADTVSKWLITITDELSPFVQVQTESGRADPTPVSPNTPVNALIAGGLGFLLTSGLLLATESFARRRANQLATVAPVVARIDRALESPSRMAQGVLKNEPNASAWLDAVAPAFLHVRSLAGESASGIGARRIAVLGWPEARVRSGVSTSLAVALALEGSDTALVDLDFRHPSLHKLCGSASGPGVSELIKSSKTARPSFATTAVQGLRVLPNGHKAVPNAALLTPRAIERTAQGTDESWMIVFDIPVRRTIAEFALISEKVDAVILVIDEAVLRRADIGFLAGLRAAGVHVGGLVVIGAPGLRAQVLARVVAIFRRLRRQPSATEPIVDGAGNDRTLGLVDTEEAEEPDAPADEAAGAAPAASARRPANVRASTRTGKSTRR